MRRKKLFSRARVGGVTPAGKRLGEKPDSFRFFRLNSAFWLKAALIAALAFGLGLSTGERLFSKPAFAAGPLDSGDKVDNPAPSADKPMAPLPYEAVNTIKKPQRWEESKNGEVEVLYFFWYGCPACKGIDDMVTVMASRLPEGIKFKKLPAAFVDDSEWMVHASLFWALESLGVEEKLHKAVFQAVQPGESLSHGPLQLTAKESQKAFAKANNLDLTTFSLALDSPFVYNMSRKTLAYVNAVDLSSVPSFVVNGKYIVNIQPKRPIGNFFHEVERLASAELAAAKAAAPTPANPATPTPANPAAPTNQSAPASPESTVK